MWGLTSHSQHTRRPDQVTRANHVETGDALFSFIGWTDHYTETRAFRRAIPAEHSRMEAKYGRALQPRTDVRVKEMSITQRCSYPELIIEFILSESGLPATSVARTGKNVGQCRVFGAHMATLLVTSHTWFTSSHLWKLNYSGPRFITMLNAPYGLYRNLG